MLGNKKRKKFILLASLAALVIVGAGAGIFFALHGPLTSKTTQYPGPTSEEQTAGNTVKQTIVDEQQKQDSTKSQVPSDTTTVTISYAGFSGGIADINAYADYYDEGECTITFTQGSRTITKTVTAYKDVRTTVCANPKVPRSEFPTTGEWSTHVVYNSADGLVKGESTPQNITIQ